MTWKIFWSSRALKDLSQLDKQIQQRIHQALERFAMSGSGDLKRLHGTPTEFRLRVGDWRIRLSFDYGSHTILVIRVMHRSNAYRA